MSARGDGDLFIGIDLGTTLCKCVVADERLHILGSASRRIPIVARRGGEIEQDAELWWVSSCEAIAELLALPAIKAERVRGIGLSTQGISFVPVDEHCASLRPAFSWMDMRAGAQMEKIRAAEGEEALFSATGKRCSAAYTLPKLLWFKEHEAETYRRAYKILMPLDFLIARFTGEFVTDHTMASGTMFYDIRGKAWSANILGAFGLDGAKLPALRWSGEAAGTIRKDVAEKLGLPPSVVVSVGGQDQKIAAFGAGIDTARTTISLGTAMAILRQCEKPMLDPLMRIPCFTDLVRDRWVIEGSSDCCSILDWMRTTFFPGIDYDGLNRMAASIEREVNPVTVLPFFSGAGSPHYAPDVRGFMYGLDYSTGHAQLIRGFYEGIACLIRSNLSIMEELAGPIEELRIFGGGSRSGVWCQIIADMNGKPVSSLTTSEAASVGALILAGRGCGLFADPADAAEARKIRTVYSPRGEYAGRCEEKYREYCVVRDRNLPVANERLCENSMSGKHG